METGVAFDVKQYRLSELHFIIRRNIESLVNCQGLMIKIKIPAGGSWPWQSPGDPHHIDPEGPNWWDIDPALRALKCYVAVHPHTPNESLTYRFCHSINIALIAPALFFGSYRSGRNACCAKAQVGLSSCSCTGIKIGPTISTISSGLTDWCEFGDALQKLNAKDLRKCKTENW